MALSELYDGAMIEDMRAQGWAVNEYGLPLGAAILWKLKLAYSNNQLGTRVRELPNAEAQWVEYYLLRASRLLPGLADRLAIPRPSVHDCWWGPAHGILQTEKLKRRRVQRS